MTREVWKWWYRQQRIIAREVSKANVDLCLYGTGMVKIDKELPDLIQHVPFGEVRI